MTRVLILHASVGTGHRSAAQALAQAFTAVPDAGAMEVRVEDTLDFGSRSVARAIVRGYLELSSRAPSVWKALYEATDLPNAQELHTAGARRGRLERPLFPRLRRLVRDFAPHAIVCTHFLPIELLATEAAAGAATPPMYCVVTDYIAHGMWLNAAVARYFVAAEVTRLAMVERGVPQARIHATGIPVRPDIAVPKDSGEMRLRHGLPGDRPLITLFGGGLDPDRVRQIVERTIAGPDAATLAVVAGRNEELAAELAPLRDGPQVALRRFGQIDFVDDLVAASDLVITKAGGLIVSEVLARATPLIIIDPILGQEEWNADFVAGSGAGMQLRFPDSVAMAARYLVADPRRLALMRRQAQRVGRPRAALDVAASVLGDLPERSAG